MCVPVIFSPKNKFYLLMQGGLNLYKTTSDLFLRNDPTLTLKVNFFVNQVTGLTFSYVVISLSFQLKFSFTLLKVYARCGLSVTIAIRSRSWHFRPPRAIGHYDNLRDHESHLPFYIRFFTAFYMFCENTVFDGLFSFFPFVSQFDDEQYRTLVLV